MIEFWVHVHSLSLHLFKYSLISYQIIYSVSVAVLYLCVEFIPKYKFLNFLVSGILNILFWNNYRFAGSCQIGTERSPVFFTQLSPLFTTYINTVQYENQKIDIGKRACIVLCYFITCGFMWPPSQTKYTIISSQQSPSCHPFICTSIPFSHHLLRLLLSPCFQILAIFILDRPQ